MFAGSAGRADSSSRSKQVSVGCQPDCAEKPAAEMEAGSRLGSVWRLRPRSCGCWRDWDRDQPCHFAEVLGGGSEEELVSCTVRTSQAQAVHPHDELEVREQHLDFLSLAA